MTLTPRPLNRHQHAMVTCKHPVMDSRHYCMYPIHTKAYYPPLPMSTDSTNPPPSLPAAFHVPPAVSFARYTYCFDCHSFLWPMTPFYCSNLCHIQISFYDFRSDKPFLIGERHWLNRNVSAVVSAVPACDR